MSVPARNVSSRDGSTAQCFFQQILLLDTQIIPSNDQNLSTFLTNDKVTRIYK